MTEISTLTNELSALGAPETEPGRQDFQNYQLGEYMKKRLLFVKAQQLREKLARLEQKKDNILSKLATKETI